MEQETKGRIRVLAADDSAVMRHILQTAFGLHAHEGNGLPAMELCGMACDGEECLAEIERLRPDALVLDMEMPRLDGLGVLRRLREQGSLLPVILCSAHTERGARTTLEAMALGARDYVMKPVSAADRSSTDWTAADRREADLTAALDGLQAQLLPRLAAAMGWYGGRLSPGNPAQTAPASVRAPRVDAIVIGISTGGPSALETMLPRLPRDFPVPVLIVQHMPKLFTGALAQRLNRLCRLPVREAARGDVAEPGTVWLAPGDAHLEVLAGGALQQPGGARMHLHQQPALHSCKPAADYLFHSAARVYGPGALALVMTGMGSDGYDGARAVRAAGGTVLAQDERSSAVWGMPGRVARAGLAECLLPLAELADALTARVADRTGERTGERLAMADATNAGRQEGHLGLHR